MREYWRISWKIKCYQVTTGLIEEFMGIIIILLILGSVHSSGRGSCGTPNRPNSNIGKHLGPCSRVESGLRFRIEVQGLRGGNLTWRFRGLSNYLLLGLQHDL